MPNNGYQGKTWSAGDIITNTALNDMEHGIQDVVLVQDTNPAQDPNTYQYGEYNKIWVKSSESKNVRIPTHDELLNSYSTSSVSSPYITTFSDGAENVPVKNLTTSIKSYTTTSGEPSPSNYKAINGFSNIRVGICRRNLADISKLTPITGTTVTSIDNKTYRITTDGSRTYRAANIPFLQKTYPPGTYYIKFKVKANPVVNSFTLVGLRTIEGNSLKGNLIHIVDSNIEKSYSTVFTTSDNTYFSYVGNGNTIGDEYATDVTICDLIISKVDIPYEPYVEENTVNITFPSEAGTVYGGTLDVTNGILTITHNTITIDGINKKYTAKGSSTTRDVYYFGVNDGAIFNEEARYLLEKEYIENGFACSIAPFKDSKSTSPSYFATAYIGLEGTQLQLRLSIDHSEGINGNEIEDPDEALVEALRKVNAFANDLYNANKPIQYVYPLKNSIQRQLTPTELATVLGNNSVYVNCGDLSITYCLNPNSVKQKADMDVALGAYCTNTASGAVASFSNGGNNVSIKELVVNIESYQPGSGDPSSINIRPINGWAGVNITKTGKNLFDQKLMKNQETENIINLYAPPGTQLTMSSSAPIQGTSGLVVYFCAATGPIGSNIDLVYDGNSKTRTVSDDGFVRIIQKRVTTENSFQDYQFQVEIGSVATEYEPFNGSIYSVTFPSQIGKVYGGTFNMTTGMLSVNKEYISLPTISGTSISGNVRRWYTYANFSNRPVVCCDSLIASNETKASSIGYVYIDSGRICITPDWGQNVTTVNEFNSLLLEHPINLVVTLATPILYALDSVDIQTLLGTNTIFADTGDVSVTYHIDPNIKSEEIKNKMETLDHIAMSAYTIDTASTKMANFNNGAENVPIKDLIIDINPFQSGSEDPSPTNIRPINGWKKVNITHCGENLLPITCTSGIISGVTFTVSDGIINVNGMRNASSNSTFVIGSVTLPEGRYILSGGAKNDNFYLQVYMPDGTATKETNGTVEILLTETTLITVRIFMRGGSTAYNLKFSPIIRVQTYSNELEEFEEYKGNVYTVTFPADIGTVYGGQLNVATGELIINKIMFESTWGKGTNEQAIGSTITKKKYLLTEPFKSNLPQKHNSICNLCNYALNSSETSHYSLMMQQVGVDINIYFELYLPNETASNQVVQLVYEINNPIYYQFDLNIINNIKTLLGVNNFFTDIGDRIKVIYCSDPTINKNKIEDNIVVMSSEILKLSAAIFGDKILIFNSDGTVSWEEASS